MNKRLTKVSKYLSFILCHEPDSIGLELDADGFADIETLVQKANECGKSIKKEYVLQVIEQSEEKRFALSDDGLKIRANEAASKPKPAPKPSPKVAGEFKPSPWDR